MDPVSFSASILTLLITAGNSCQRIHDLMVGISDAPYEIHSQTAKVRCLHQTISNLIRVYDLPDLPPDLKMDSVLRVHIEDFLFEIERINSKVQSKGQMLQKSRGQNIWARVKWLLSDRQMRKFYESLDRWNAIFSQAVSATHLYVDGCSHPSILFDLHDPGLFDTHVTSIFLQYIGHI
jgi:hypothetical protein